MKRKCQRNKAKKLQLLEKQLKKQRNLTNLYKTRLIREKNKQKVGDSPHTPRTKAKRLLRHGTYNTVRKALDFHNVLLDSIRQKYKCTRKKWMKQAYSQLFTGKLIKKYKLRSEVQRQLGFSYKVYKINQKSKAHFKQTKKSRFKYQCPMSCY